MSEYPQRVAVVEGGKVKAVATVDSVQEREAYGEERYGVFTWTLAEADSSSMPSKLQVEICEALRASQDAADLAETGRRLMARTNHGSGGAPPDLGGPPAQKPPEPTSDEWPPIAGAEEILAGLMAKRDASIEQMCRALLTQAHNDDVIIAWKDPSTSGDLAGMADLLQGYLTELETANQLLRRDNERLVAQLDSEPWVPS